MREQLFRFRQVPNAKRLVAACGKPLSVRRKRDRPDCTLKAVQGRGLFAGKILQRGGRIGQRLGCCIFRLLGLGEIFGQVSRNLDRCGTMSTKLVVFL